MLSPRPANLDRSRIDHYQHQPRPRPQPQHRTPQTADHPQRQISLRPRSMSLTIVAARYSELRNHKPLSKVERIPETTLATWELPHLTKTHWEAERTKKRVPWRRSVREENQFPAHVFKNLPREVYDGILMQLEQVHLGSDRPCPNCYLADLANLSLVSRAWDKATTSRMYRRVLLIANEEHSRLPKLNIRGTSRLKLLRRTLRECNAIARYVRELHLFGFQSLYENASIEKEEIVNLVASLVMACPFLERLVGFSIPYTHDFDRLSHALSTRPNMRERIWLLKDKEPELSDDEDVDLDRYYLASCDPTECFLALNAKYPLLSTLVLHQTGYEASISLNFRSVVGTLRQLPALRHLSLSGLSSSSFTNLALNALPPNLQSLRLESLPGINDKGLQRFANNATSKSLATLTLMELSITSLTTISYILSERFPQLDSFTIAQSMAPRLASQAEVSSFKAPSLTKLHWEFSSEAGPIPAFPSQDDVSVSSETPSFPFASSEPICCLATSVLATSIRGGGLPSLRKVRIPHDPQGVIQALCQPLATALLPADASYIISYRSATSCIPILPDVHLSHMDKARHSQCSRCHSPRADSAIETPASGISSSTPALMPARSRLAAQSRILAARKQRAMTFKVFDPYGRVQINKAIAGHIGDTRSKIVYDLTSDPGRLLGQQANGVLERNTWKTGIEDVVSERAGEVSDMAMHAWTDVGCGHPGGRKVGRNLVKIEDIF